MKNLKLTNTEDCLKLAECLIGSEIITLEGTNNLVAVVDSSFIRSPRSFGESFRGNCSTDAIIIPLEFIKLNVFKCMEHGIRIINDELHGIVSPSDLFFDKLSAKTYLVSGCDLLLDLDCLPNGAELITI